MMKLLFYDRKTYHVDRPVDQVSSRLHWIVTRRWEDYSIDLVGRLYSGGKFSFKSKWAWTNIQWLDNNPGKIRGEFCPVDDGTMIRITTEPNKLLTGCFYGFLVLLLMEVLGWENIIPLSKPVKIAFLAGVNSILLILALIFRNTIRKRFEDLMDL